MPLEPLDPAPNDPPTTPIEQQGGGDAPASSDRWRKLGQLAVPAVVGAAVALGVVAGTGQLGGDTTTVVQQGSDTITQATAPAQSSAEAAPAKGMSVGEVVKRESPAVVLISNQTAQGGSLGSGFLIDNDGHIITNAHVVDGATKTTVTFSDGTESPARILGVDKSTDVAVVKVSNTPASVNPVPLGNSGDLTVGQSVIAIGNPYGYSLSLIHI